MKFLFLPYLQAFFGAFIATLLLTPIVRALHRRWGMVDKPDPRRINKVPIPRGGGVALVVGTLGSYLILHFITGRAALQGITDVQFYKLAVLGFGVMLLGLADDRFSLSPKIKLLGQIVLAVLVWWWADLGFVDLMSFLPPWADLLVTVFWLVGAMNAFNLIDGLDGLASGLALIAVIGMAGALFLVSNPQATLFYIAFAGGLLGFLRYNFNPASIFLGDSGSMFIGFMLAALPLCSHAMRSFFVSVGVPLLAMGVPIFDTSLAIIRRTIRRVLNETSQTQGESAAVMTADADHLHHRILRSVGLDQRKAAFVLYLMALVAVSVGLASLCLRSRAAGLWMVALAVAVVVILRDMARVEIFDAGRLLNNIAHTNDTSSRRRFARIAVPFYVVADILAMVGSLVFCLVLLRHPFTVATWHVEFPVRISVMFAALVMFRTYRTIWARALTSNFVRLFVACLGGAVAGSVIVYYSPSCRDDDFLTLTIIFALLSFTLLLTMRMLRRIVRDWFYAIDCGRLMGRKDVSRILVYGSGLRYQAFRRELVRRTTANNRIIVGIIDDDILLRNHYIGGLRVLGTLLQAPEIINSLNVNAVVIACDITPEWMEVVRKTLVPTGVKVTLFSYSESEINL